MSLFSIFATAILPVVSIAAMGVLLGRWRAIDVGPLNTVTLYVLVPALIFHSIATTSMGGDTVLKVIFGAGAYLIAMMALSDGVARVIGESQPLRSALVLAASVPNAGNFGIPLSEFAFGAVGRSTAVLFLVGQAVAAYTAGVYVASRAGGTRSQGAVMEVFKLPLIYAVVGAIGARWLGIVPPIDSTTMVTLKLVGDSSIPLMLLILGIQLASTNYGTAVARVGVPSTLKLGVAPFVGLGIVLLLGINNPTAARVFVLECSTPAAVTPIILLVEYAEGTVAGITAPEYVSTTVLVTTIASVPVLTGLIALLQSGILI